MTPSIKKDWVRRAERYQAEGRFVGRILAKDAEVDRLLFGVMSPPERGYAERAASELEIPEWTARLASSIFLCLPTYDANSFPVEFLTALPALPQKHGAWDVLFHKTGAQRLRRLLLFVGGMDDKFGLADITRTGIALHESEIDNESVWGDLRASALVVAKHCEKDFDESCQLGYMADMRYAMETAALAMVEAATKDSAFLAAKYVALVGWMSRNAPDSESAMRPERDELLKAMRGIGNE